MGYRKNKKPFRNIVFASIICAFSIFLFQKVQNPNFQNDSEEVLPELRSPAQESMGMFSLDLSNSSRRLYCNVPVHTTSCPYTTSQPTQVQGDGILNQDTFILKSLWKTMFNLEQGPFNSTAIWNLAHPVRVSPPFALTLVNANLPATHARIESILSRQENTPQRTNDIIEAAATWWGSRRYALEAVCHNNSPVNVPEFQRLVQTQYESQNCRRQYMGRLQTEINTQIRSTRRFATTWSQFVALFLFSSRNERFNILDSILRNTETSRRTTLMTSSLRNFLFNNMLLNAMEMKKGMTFIWTGWLDSRDALESSNIGAQVSKNSFVLLRDFFNSQKSANPEYLNPVWSHSSFMNTAHFGSLNTYWYSQFENLFNTRNPQAGSSVTFEENARTCVRQFWNTKMPYCSAALDFYMNPFPATLVNLFVGQYSGWRYYAGHKAFHLAFMLTKLDGIVASSNSSRNNQAMNRYKEALRETSSVMAAEMQLKISKIPRVDVFKQCISPEVFNSYLSTSPHQFPASADIPTLETCPASAVEGAKYWAQELVLIRKSLSAIGEVWHSSSFNLIKSAHILNKSMREKNVSSSAVGVTAVLTQKLRLYFPSTSSPDMFWLPANYATHYIRNAAETLPDTDSIFANYYWIF